MPAIPGIDVSNLQRTIDWVQVAAAGYQFAVAKASEGAHFRDPYLATNLAGMTANGIARAVYHFALPASNTAADEAAWFLQYAPPLLVPGDVIALDMEEDPYHHTIPADCGPWALEWLRSVETALVCKPLLYTNLDLIQNHGLAAVAANGNGLWLAAPGAANPAAPAPWPFIAIHQHSWTGRVPGINGDVDLDTFFGDAAAFKRYGLPAPAPPAKPPFDATARLGVIADVANGASAAAVAARLAQYL